MIKKHKLFDFRLIPMDMARLVCAVLPLIFRLKRLTPEGEKYTTKVKGGAIIAANHTSFLDPFLVGVTFWYRRMYFLVAEVVLKKRLRAWLLKGVGAIKIDRNKTDIDAINKSTDKLKRGFLLTIFPQGGIQADTAVDTLKSGAVLIALRANVPIIPMYSLPRKKWYNKRCVIIGNAINPAEICTKKMPSTADINNISGMLSNELNRCRDFAQTLMER